MTATDVLAGHDRSDTQYSVACEDPDSATDQMWSATHPRAVGSGPNLLGDQTVRDTQDWCVAGDTTSGQAAASAMPITSSPGRNQTPPDAEGLGTPTPAKNTTLPTGSAPGSVSQDDRQPEATPDAAPIHLSPRAADPTSPSAPAMAHPNPKAVSPVLADPLLALAADVLDDLERVRIANENRLRQLTRDETDVDGEERGFGLTLDHPDVARLAALVEALTKAEHDAELQLKRTLRRHPLGPWVKSARGVGEKQAARLLASVGDPYWNDLHNRPRTVSELWAYCGYHVLPAGQRSSDTHEWSASGAQLRTGHDADDSQNVVAGSVQPPAGQSALDAHRSGASGDLTGGNPDQTNVDTHRSDVGVAAHRQRGQRANWSADAKMRAHLVAASIVKQLSKPCLRPEGQAWADHVDGCVCSPYRVLYDQAREKYVDTPHPVACKRCGPAGKPALAGSPRSAGHQEAMAYRIVAKAVLRDLWREAKRLHELHDGQASADAQVAIAFVDPTPDPPDGHEGIGAQSPGAVGDPTPELHDGHGAFETQTSGAVVGSTPGETP